MRLGVITQSLSRTPGIFRGICDLDEHLREEEEMN
jgi:hypothetical protein